MNGWTCLESGLLLRVYINISLADLIQCQLVCKSWSVPAQHMLYSTIKLDSSQKMIRFLNSQLNSRSMAAQFIKTLDIHQPFNPMTLAAAEEEDIVSRLFQLLVRNCTNIEYIIGNSDSSRFWMNMMEVDTDKHWKKLKCIPYNDTHNWYYKVVANKFKNSITELTIKDDGTQQADDLLKKLAADFPKLEALEVYDNTAICSLFELENITSYLPNLHNLCLDRGGSPTPIQSSNNSDGMNGKQQQQVLSLENVVNDPNMKSIAVNIKAFNSDVVNYFIKKYTHLERVKFVILDTLTPQITADEIQHLVQYCMSVSLNYQLKFSIKKAVLPLDIYYSMLPSDEPKNLSIAYTVNQLKPEHYPPNFERAIIDLNKNEYGPVKNAAVYFSFYQNDKDVITLTQPIFRKIGHHLTNLTISLDPGMKFEPHHDIMNGFFLDNYIFSHCTSLKRLELGYFILSYCNHQQPIKSESIQEVKLYQCTMATCYVLHDLTYRLPNLRHVTFIDCNFDNMYQNNGYLYDLRFSHLDSFSILTLDSLLKPFVQIYLDLYIGPNHQRSVYFQRNPNSTKLELLTQQDTSTNFNSNLVCVRLYCQSIKYLRISCGSFNAEHNFETPIITID